MWLLYVFESDITLLNSLRALITTKQRIRIKKRARQIRHRISTLWLEHSLANRNQMNQPTQRVWVGETASSIVYLPISPSTSTIWSSKWLRTTISSCYHWRYGFSTGFYSVIDIWIHECKPPKAMGIWMARTHCICFSPNSHFVGSQWLYTQATFYWEFEHFTWSLYQSYHVRYTL